MAFGLGILLMISHFFGEFYLCSKKQTNVTYKHIMINSIIYQILFLLLLTLFGLKTNFILIILIIGISHYLVSSITYLINHQNISKKWIHHNFFFIQQSIYLLIIFLCWWYIKSVEVPSFTRHLFTNDSYYLRLVFAFLLVCKPSNIIFKKIFIHFKPIQEDKTYKNAGATIGTLERVLILICIINSLYSSIGLILTAKSIARYNRITQEPAFSEYYLMGTLSSVLFTIVIYVLCFNILF